MTPQMIHGRARVIFCIIKPGIAVLSGWKIKSTGLPAAGGMHLPTILMFMIPKPKPGRSLAVSRLRSMPLPQVNFQGKIYVMGGTNNGEKIDSIYTYSPISGNWVLSIVKLPMPMSYHKAVVIDNYIYVFFSPDDDPDGHLYRYKFGNTAVDENEGINNEISVYPNPSDGSFKLSCPGYTGKYYIKISDVLGRVVYEAENLIPSGDGEITVSLPEQETGVYYLQVYHNNRLSVKTIVID